MSRKIFVIVPMLCLSLQSTGYASAMRELVELGTPLKRVMSMLRPVVPLAREYSSQIARQYTPATSRLSAYINPVPQNPLIQRSFTTLPINRLTTELSSVVLYPGVLERRYFSGIASEKGSDSSNATMSPYGSSKIPLLKITDSWQYIAEVTSENCVKTVGTFKERFYNPARWLNRLAHDFSTLSDGGRSSLKNSKTLREDVIDTAYFWQKEMENTPEELKSANEDQKRALHNINIIRLKALQDVE
jgi:hypothetical protein